MERVVCLVDGFNLYHSLEVSPSLRQYKWLDLDKLCRCFTTRKQQLEELYYFTALTHWNPEKVRRHRTFIRALQFRGARIVYGEFRRVDRICRLCHGTYKTFEEKQTDVNIAIYLFRLAIQDRFDTALVVSGDSDLVPSIDAVHATFPSKRIGILIPPGRRAGLLKDIADFHAKITERHLRSSLLDFEIDLGDGETLRCPDAWR